MYFFIYDYYDYCFIFIFCKFSKIDTYIYFCEICFCFCEICFVIDIENNDYPVGFDKIALNFDIWVFREKNRNFLQH